MHQKAGFIHLFCTAMTGEAWGKSRSSTNLPCKPLLFPALASLWPAVHYGAVMSHRTTFPSTMSYACDSTPTALCHLETSALYCMSVHVVGITSDPGWWHLGLCFHLALEFVSSLAAL